MSWLVYFLLTLGVVYLLTESYILAPYRMFASSTGLFFRVLVYCRSCTGFWVGATLNAYFPMHHPLRPLLSAFCVMLVGYVWTALTDNNAFYAEQAPATPHLEAVEQEGEKEP